LPNPLEIQDNTIRSRGDPGFEVCSFGGTVEDWAAILDAAVERREQVARAAWRRQIVAAVSGGCKLTKADLDRPITVRWGAYDAEETLCPLRHVLRGNVAPATYSMGFA
jgi:hypothetical protein